MFRNPSRSDLVAFSELLNKETDNVCKAHVLNQDTNGMSLQAFKKFEDYIDKTFNFSNKS